MRKMKLRDSLSKGRNFDLEQHTAQIFLANSNVWTQFWGIYD